MHIRVLLVDDHVDNANALALALGRQSEHTFDVMLACNGLQALKFLQQEGPFDLVATDLAMPVMDGRTLLRFIKEGACEAGPRPTPGTVPTILMSALALSLSREDIMEEGAAAVLFKPILPFYLAQEIVRLVDESRRSLGTTQEDGSHG